MRPIFPALPSVLLGSVIAVPLALSPCLAQVSTNAGALDALGHAPAAKKSRKKPKEQKQPPAQAPKAARRVISSVPYIPDAPPPVPVFKAPVINVPLHPPPPPPAVTVVKEAKGDATPISAGLRVTFAAGSADMNAEMISAVINFLKVLKENPTRRAYVYAYSSGSKDDPSTPRRVSLQRALAIRSILIHNGIASTRIYIRPIGLPKTAQEHVSADRVDLTTQTTPP